LLFACVAAGGFIGAQFISGEGWPFSALVHISATGRARLEPLFVLEDSCVGVFIITVALAMGNVIAVGKQEWAHLRDQLPLVVFLLVLVTAFAVLFWWQGFR
jgi:hypothetical protein